MNPKYITIHCSATSPQTNYTVERLKRDHLARGFSDIGYHKYITRDGVIHDGRPYWKQGAQVSGHNKDNIGVCMEGGVNASGKAENNYTPEQWASLSKIVKEIKDRYNIKEENIKGHRDWSPDLNGDGIIQSYERIKECPCFDVQSKLSEILA